MKKLQNKKGFTLIELLVVITIIGILAVGATATYTSQIQKARDSNRIQDIQAVRSAVEQSYGDNSQYPATVSSWTLREYIAVPRDSKDWYPAASGATLGYWYGVSTLNWGPWVERQRYELSTAFENVSNVATKALTDNWNEATRFEIGIPNIDTGLLDITTSTWNYIAN